MNASVHRLRHLGIAEGISWLTLLLVAMPLKYGADIPEAVSVVGMAHGVLFVWFFYQLSITHLQRGWSGRFSAAVGVSAFLPFGFLWIDRRLRAAAADPG